MTTSRVTDDELSAQMRERITDILFVVADVSKGDYTNRLRSDLPPEHPLTTLYDGINSMVESIGEAQERGTQYRHELEEKLATIDAQRAAIRELSTPIIEVWDRVLCLPIVGVLDTTRSADLTEALLRTVVEKQIECAILDITGIQVMDTGTADHFLRMARAVRLLGASCMLSGVNPAIAQTIVHMGVDLSGIATVRSLRQALMLVGMSADR